MPCAPQGVKGTEDNKNKLKIRNVAKKITLTGSFIFSTARKEVVTEDILMWRALCRLNHQHLILLQE
jgi:hypothetical protein